MCWGIFPFLVPCLSRGVIWADRPSFLCSGPPPPEADHLSLEMH
ncbi:hypothetical protein T4D_8355 [Trichinella pseudospiralis]|uniref:Uncharacterized protein n=1 Tax=Trichinella pseudospiralis TaxID=6337 RepID=A0A0V1DQB1_TRIPS|nr:hypothetical protein T4D_8355 [Trichinella pseudospiralis]